MIFERRKFSPPQVAKQLGVSRQKVVAWIRSGELRAINVGEGPKKRPRYLIDLDDLARFEAGRAVIPIPQAEPARRKRRSAAEIKKFY